MLNKIVLAGATAAVIAAAGLIPSAASAAAPWHGPNGGYSDGGNNYNGGNNNYGGGFFPQPPQRCTPVTKTTKWWDRWGHPHFYTQVVGQKCVPLPPPHHGPFPHHPGNWGW